MNDTQKILIKYTVCCLLFYFLYDLPATNAETIVHDKPTTRHTTSVSKMTVKEVPVIDYVPQKEDSDNDTDKHRENTSSEQETTVIDNKQPNESKQNSVVSNTQIAEFDIVKENSSDGKKEVDTERKNPDKAANNDVRQQVNENNEDTNTTDEYPISSEKYFSSFNTNGPEFTCNFSEGGDLAGVGSLMYCMSSYSINNISNSNNDRNNQELVSFNLSKHRTAGLFSADTFLSFSVYTKLKAPIIINKKKTPLFEMSLMGKKNIVKLQKISSYSERGFSVNTGNVHFFDELYVPGAKVIMLIQTQDGTNVRIPIPEEVIQQWKQVTTADLRKMKNDYEKQ